jgi:hypothetical protein
MASPNPGAFLSITAAVASGVMSLGLNPVPPVVMITSISPDLVHSTRAALMDWKSSGRVSLWTTRQPCPLITSSIAGPEASRRTPSKDRSEIVINPKRKRLLSALNPAFHPFLVDTSAPNRGLYRIHRGPFAPTRQFRKIGLPDRYRELPGDRSECSPSLEVCFLTLP